MTQLSDRIAQFRKMATDDPENELGHFRLGQLLSEDGQLPEAVKSFERTLELSPFFSKVFQLLGETYSKLGDNAKAVEILTKGYAVADERGDKLPRDAMAALLAKLGAPVPTAAVDVGDGPETGFKCQRPGCPMGKRAKPMAKPPMPDATGKQIQDTVCTDCWDAWFKDFSVKVINELRLDLSSEFGQAEYDKHMREFLGLEESPKT